MHTFGFLLPLTALLISQSAFALESNSRTALVIGNAGYENEAGPLKNTVNDARAMAAALRELGFHVIEKQNVSRDQLIKAVMEFRLTLMGKEVGLFYFSGHGISVNGANYLLPIKSGYNTQGTDDATLRMLAETRLFNVEQAVADMKTSGARCNLIILDACRTTAMARTSRTRDALGKIGLTEMNPPAGSLVAFATDAGHTALDGVGQNGLYTDELLKHLKTPGITIEQVFKRTRAGVLERSNGIRIPAEYSRLVGEDIYLAGTTLAETYQTRSIKAEALTAPSLNEIKRLIRADKPSEAIATLQRRADIEGPNSDTFEPFTTLLNQVKDALKQPAISSTQNRELVQTCDLILAALPSCLPHSHAGYDELLAKTHNRRGDSLLGLGRADEALDALNKALPLAPDDSYILYNRGRAHLILGDENNAKADFSAASDPKFNQPKARQLALEALSKLK